MSNGAIDEKRIRDALALLKMPEQLFEIRIIKNKKIISGYFTDPEKLIKAFDKADLRDANVFYSLNAIKKDCYSREQRDRFRESKVTTSDSDIESYQWLLFDLDPVRPSGISSTKEELIKAHEMAKRVVEYLRQREFPAPIMALSGNGIHLLYSISLKNRPDNVDIIDRCLKAVSQMFDDGEVEIDKRVFNPARVSKLFGTTACKGADTPERPHRMARIVSVPDEIEMVSREKLLQLANEYIDEHPKSSAPLSKHQSSFDIEGWISEHGIRVAKVQSWKDTTKYVLEECPFDETHKAPDATIIKQPSGAIAFKCFHNSCSGHDWRELRLKYEPDAYDDKRAEDDARIDAGWKQYKAFNRQRQDITYENAIRQTNDVKEIFKSAKEILSLPKEERICIPTGLIEFDKRVGGLAKGEISLVSGLRGAAKSTWLSQIALNAIDKGYTSLFYSGELRNDRFMNWMMLQAAGRDFVIKSKKYENYYYCRDDIKPKIAEWMDHKFYLYDNNYGNNFSAIVQVLNEAIKQLKADFVVIDNMSILDLTDISSDRRIDKWDQQKLFVESLKNVASVCNCHIIFVAHPRKAMGFLRLDDVGGSGSLGNLIDNAFIMHRANRDFEIGYKQYTGKKTGWTDGGNNVIEVVKERETGWQDAFIPLWYDPCTKRLMNNPEERIIYGWDKDGFIGGFVDPEDKTLPWNQ